MQSWSLLIEIVILLGVCLVTGGILSHFRQSPLVGYLLAGMLLGGPGSLNIVQSESHIEAIAELGVALLLFSLGLEFSWIRLKELGIRIMAAGAVQVVLTGVVTALAGLLFGLRPASSIALGAMLSLSSTAAVLRVFIDRGEIDSLHGRNSLGILLVQDMAVVPLAIVISILVGAGDPREIVVNVVKVVGLAAGLVLGLYVVLNKLALWALNRFSVERNREQTVLLAVVVGFGSAWCAHAVGVSPALGTFVAGMFLGGSPFATQIRADVSSLRVVLLTLFFGAVGMVADPLWIADHLLFVLAAAAVLIVVKTLLIWGILRTIGQPEGVSAATGLSLGQVGEFAFVLGVPAVAGGVLDEQTYMLVISCAIVTLFLTPYLVLLAPRLAALVESVRGGVFVARDADVGHGIDPDVVIVGFGPAGQSVAHALTAGPRRVVVLDLNPQAARLAGSMGFAGTVGDATNLDVLEHAHVASAQLVVITLPARSAALVVLQHVRRLNPGAHVVVRSRYQIHQNDFERRGAHAVFGDEAEVGRRLSEYVTSQLSELPQTPASDGNPDSASPPTGSDSHPPEMDADTVE